MEPDDEDLLEIEPAADMREEVLNCRGLAERALGRGEPEEAIRLLEKAMRIGGAECPGLRDVLEAARRQIALRSGAQLADVVAKPQSRETQASKGGVVADRYFWSQTP